MAEFTAHMDVCTKINLGDILNEVYGKSTYNYWGMNEACVIILNGCAGQKCSGISPTVFHSWTNALRGTSGILLGGKGTNESDCVFAGFIFCFYMTSYNPGPHRDTLVYDSTSFKHISHTQHEDTVARSRHEVEAKVTPPFSAVGQ